MLFSNGAEFWAIATTLPKHSYTIDSSVEERTMFNEVISSFCDNRLVPTIRLIFSQCDLISMSATPRGRCFCDARRTGTSDDSKGGEFVLEVDDEDDVDDATVVALSRRMNGSFCEGLLLL